MDGTACRLGRSIGRRRTVDLALGLRLGRPGRSRSLLPGSLGLSLGTAALAGFKLGIIVDVVHRLAALGAAQIQMLDPGP